MGPLRPLFRLFLVFFTKTLQFSQQIKFEKCPASIWHWDLNPRSSDREPHPVTTRPGHPPCKDYFTALVPWLDLATSLEPSIIPYWGVSQSGRGRNGRKGVSALTATFKTKNCIVFFYQNISLWFLAKHFRPLFIFIFVRPLINGMDKLIWTATAL